MISVRTMRAAGLTDAQIVKLLAADEDEKRADRNELARQRMRRYRERKHEQKQQPRDDVTRNSVTAAVSVEIPQQNQHSCYDVTRNAPPYIDSLTSSLTLKKVRKKDSPPIPPSAWELTEPMIAYALAQGWPMRKVAGEFQRFRDRALAKGVTYKKVDAAWRNWVTSPYQTPSNGVPTNGHQRRLDAWDAALDKLHAAATGSEDLFEFGRALDPAIQTAGGG